MAISKWWRRCILSGALVALFGAGCLLSGGDAAWSQFRRKSDDPPKKETPPPPSKPESPKPEPPKSEPKPEPPRQEPKPEPPKPDPPKVEPKREPPQQNNPKPEPPRQDPPKSEPPKQEPPKTEPKPEPPKQETPKFERKSEPTKSDPKPEPPKQSPKPEPSRQEPKPTQPQMQAESNRPKPVDKPRTENPRPEPPRREPVEFERKSEQPRIEPPRTEPSGAETSEPPKVENNRPRPADGSGDAVPGSVPENNRPRPAIGQRPRETGTMVEKYERKTRGERTRPKTHPHYEDEDYYPYDPIFIDPFPPIFVDPVPNLPDVPPPDEAEVIPTPETSAPPVSPETPSLSEPDVEEPEPVEEVARTLEETVADLETAWMTKDLEMVMRHVSEARPILVYTGEQISHEMTAEQYYLLTRDAFENLETERFSLNNTYDVTDSRATVSGEHLYKGPDGKHRHASIRYTLEREGRNWVISEIRYQVGRKSRQTTRKPDWYEASLRGGRRLPDDPDSLELAVSVRARNGAPFEEPLRLRFVMVDDTQKVYSTVSEPGELSITGSRSEKESDMQALTYIARISGLNLQAKAVRVKIFLARLEKDPAKEEGYRLQGLAGFDLGWFRLPPVSTSPGRLLPSSSPQRSRAPAASRVSPR